MRSRFSEEALLELLMLAGYYRTVSYLTNVLRLTPEPRSASFPIHKGLLDSALSSPTVGHS